MDGCEAFNAVFDHFRPFFLWSIMVAGTRDWSVVLIKLRDQFIVRKGNRNIYMNLYFLIDLFTLMSNITPQIINIYAYNYQLIVSKHYARLGKLHTQIKKKSVFCLSLIYFSTTYNQQFLFGQNIILVIRQTPKVRFSSPSFRMLTFITLNET